VPALATSNNFRDSLHTTARVFSSSLPSLHGLHLCPHPHTMGDEAEKQIEIWKIKRVS
jgi:hypothetical protein